MQLSQTKTLLIFACHLHLIRSQITLVPEVTIKEGTLRGSGSVSRGGKKYYSFTGIRYAERPDRFKIAEPSKKWDGTRDANVEGAMCLQTYPSAGALLGSKGSEDCLFLNVFTPRETNGNKLPVMVFIHGGAFLFGSGNDYGSEYVMNEDIILVTFNYRLGVFGFLYNEDDQIPGNLGMRDQVEALLWVQRNVHHFGGDPDAVTIVGESSGAASVHLMMLSPMAKGLFHRAIMMSGSSLSPWALSACPKSNTERLAMAVGCPTGNPVAMIDCLRITDADTISEIQNESRWGPLPEFHWAPVVERGLNVTNPFLSEHPRLLLENKHIPNNVPVIMGVNKNEGAAFFSAFILNDPHATHEMNSDWNRIAPLAFNYMNDRYEVTPRMDEASFKIRQFYFGHYPIGYETERRLTDLFSDRYFVHGIHMSANFHCQMAPTYLYLYTFSTGFSMLNALGLNNFEPPTHGDGMSYLFPLSFRPSLSNPVDMEFSSNFVKLWTSFAATGKPESTWGSVQVWPVTNEKEETKAITWYRLDQDTQLIHDPFHYRMKFWDHLVANELRHIKP